VRNCQEYYYDDQPLKQAASLFNSRVGITTGFGMSRIPYYPFNKQVNHLILNIMFKLQGSLTVELRPEASFGTWGGGYRRPLYVGDFWAQGSPTYANWYEGRYGTNQWWRLPLFPFASGIKGTEVCMF
jgi:hypothetical protein